MHGDAYDPDNSYTICFDCHANHHSGSDYKINFCSLREENFRFAQTLLGEYAGDYLERYYDVGNRQPWEDEDEFVRHDEPW